MARTIRGSKLDTRTARLKLAVRREPYWVPIQRGCALGYRRGPGTWLAKFRDDAGERHYEALGAADDVADGLGLSFAEAQERARAFFKRKAREAAGDFRPGDGPYTVADALRDYFAWREHHGHKSVASDRQSADALIVPELGRIALDKLTSRRIEAWKEKLAQTPARLRSRKGAQAFRPTTTEEDARRRKATCNRVLATLRAALNLAHKDGKALIADAWTRVRPYAEVAIARARYLSDEESIRLINACAPDFRSLVTAALFTGARYGELIALVVEDFHTTGTLLIRRSKSGRPRHVALTAEGQQFFARRAMGRAPGSLLLTRLDGRPWQRSDQQRPIAAACQAARIAPTNFHALRHTYASRLVMRGVPFAVIAAQLGHASTDMVEKHYGHLAPNYVSDTVRRAFGELGIDNEAANVVKMPQVRA